MARRLLLALALAMTWLAGSAMAASDEGVVTQVTKDTITILNGKGMMTTYKIAKDLVDNTRPAEKYGQAYPSRFSEVTQGCRIDVQYMKQGDDWVIYGLDVKKDKEKEKDKEK